MFAVLHHRNFRLLWLGQSTSMLGDAMVIVAIGLFVTRLTGNPSDVGIVLTAYSAPLVAFVLFGGVIADRLPRQLVMITADVVRGVVHTVLAILIATGNVQIWHMVIIGLLFSTAEAFFRPAYTGLVPQTVPESEIQSAQALSGVSREIATFASPALATALVLGVGGAAAFGLDAATFAVSALLLMRVHARERGTPVERSSMWNELKEGGRAVAERSWVWATITAFSFSILVALAPFFVLGASVAKDVYGNEAVYGFANAAWGIGTVSGAVWGARWKPRRPLRAAMAAAVPWPATITLYALGWPLWVVYGSMIIGGVGIGLFAVWWETAIAQRIPPHLISRVSSFDWMGSLLLLPLGYLLSGPAAAAFGEVEVLVVGGLLGLAACACGLLPHSTRHLTRHEESPADASPVDDSPVDASAAAAVVDG